MHVARPVCETGCVHGSHSTEPEHSDYSATDTGPRIVMSVSVSAYSKCVPRTNCALRIKKRAPRISSGIYFLSNYHENTMPETAFLGAEIAPKSLSAGASPQPRLGELTALPQTP